MWADHLLGLTEVINIIILFYHFFSMPTVIKQSDLRPLNLTVIKH